MGIGTVFFVFFLLKSGVKTPQIKWRRYASLISAPASILGLKPEAK